MDSRQEKDRRGGEEERRQSYVELEQVRVSTVELTKSHSKLFVQGVPGLIYK